eukprot:Gb_25481 [translate_table: standard]
MSMAIQSLDVGGNRTSSANSGSCGDGPEVAIMFVDVSLLLGIALRELLCGTKVPYIVDWLLLEIGLRSLEYGAKKHGLGKLGASIYGWNWRKSLLLGGLLSATDHVVAVALLKELGASKKLSTTIEGESLMNDGIALGAVALELAFEFVLVLWLGVIFNDTVIGITLTLTVSYVAYKFLDMDVGSPGIWSGVHQRQDYLEGLSRQRSYSGIRSYT